MSEEYNLLEWDLDKERDEGYTQFCVWPATVVEEGDEERLQEFMKDKFNLEHDIHITGCVVTEPDKKNGEVVEDTGGRIDFLFFVHDDDISRFAVPRLMMGIRWWEDVVGNKSHKIYPKQFLRKAKEVYSW